MTIIEYIKKCSYKDNSVGNLAKEILEDRNLPTSKNENKIIEYLNIQTKQKSINSIFQKLLADYRKKNNDILKFILNFLKENNIESIKDATNKGIATSYVETCGYLLEIPVGYEFSTTVQDDDFEELKTMNEQWVEISDGNRIKTGMLHSPKIDKEMNISFCCQEKQFKFLLSLID